MDTSMLKKRSFIKNPKKVFRLASTLKNHFKCY